MNFWGTQIQSKAGVITPFSQSITYVCSHKEFWKSDSLAFVLSLSLSSQTTSVSADVTFLKTSLVFSQRFSHQTTGSYTDLSQVNPSVLVLGRLTGSIGLTHMPNLYIERLPSTLSVFSLQYGFSNFCYLDKLRIFKINKFWLLFVNSFLLHLYFSSHLFL